MSFLEETGAAAPPIAESGDAAPAAPDKPRRIWPRVLRTVLLVLFSQYMILAFGVGLSVAATLRYFVAPQLVADFETIAKALRP